ncbi:MAG: cobalamin-binding protein [Gemmatimonadetes bacterium]|nr:cobalamin-binding protein [Gemmatimonadota bacterium]
MRIVSMLASATETVYALGLEAQLVGISHECDYPQEALRLPRVSRPRFDPAGLDSAAIDAAVRRSMQEHGSVYQIDTDRLRELRPALVLTQAVCEVCAVPTGSVIDAVGELDPRPEVVSLDAHSLEGVLASIQQVADAAGVSGRGRAVVEGLRERLARVGGRVAGRRRPKVLMLEWLDPPFATGHWVPEMVELAGGRDRLGAPLARSREVSWDELPLDPDVLFVEPCGYDLAGARADAEYHRDRLARVAGRAVATGDAWLLHSSYFSRSGPRVVDGVEVLARILHPDAFLDIELDGRAERWPSAP